MNEPIFHCELHFSILSSKTREPSRRFTRLITLPFAPVEGLTLRRIGLLTGSKITSVWWDYEKSRFLVFLESFKEMKDSEELKPSADWTEEE